MAASPLIGFGDPPSEINFSILDYHGLIDDTIPYSEETSFGKGPHYIHSYFEWLYITLYIKIFFPLGPHDSIIAYDGFYYANKVPYLEGNIEIFNFDFSNPSLSDYFCRMV